MTPLYKAVMERLKTEVPSIRWIDLDEGQIDMQKERPGIAFPGVLIGISLPKCEDQYGDVQLCRAEMIVRVVQNPPAGRTNSEAPEEVRETTMKRYELIDSVYRALQGFGTQEFSRLSRIRQAKEDRRDGLFVYRISFYTEFLDMGAEE
jgi:hypothetical protein